MGHPRPEFQQRGWLGVALALGPDNAGSCQRPGLTWAWASSRAGFQDTINAGGSDVDRGAVSRFKAPRPARCCVDHLGPPRRGIACRGVGAGRSWPNGPVHKCCVHKFQTVYFQRLGVLTAQRQFSTSTATKLLMSRIRRVRCPFPTCVGVDPAP